MTMSKKGKTMKLKTLLLLTTALLFASCGKINTEEKFCAENGFRYIEFKSWLSSKGVAPDFNKLGLPARCDKIDSE